MTRRMYVVWTNNEILAIYIYVGRIFEQYFIIKSILKGDRKKW